MFCTHSSIFQKNELLDYMKSANEKWGVPSIRGVHTKAFTAAAGVCIQLFLREAASVFSELKASAEHRETIITSFR